MLLRRWPEPAAAPASAPFEGPFVLRAFFATGVTTGQPLPVGYQFRAAAVHFEPVQRVTEDGAANDRVLGPRIGAEVAKTTLQAEHLAQTFNVAAGQRQVAEAWS